MSNRDGPRGVYVQDVGAEGARGEPRIVPGIADPHSISYSVTARKIAWSKFTARQNIWSYPLTRSGTQSITLTDPGRGLITGKFADLGKTKGPILRGLAARAPYFHNGSAPDLATLVNFYDARFGIGLSSSEKADLVNFLGAL